MGCEDRRTWNFLDTWTHEHAEAVREIMLPVRKLGAGTTRYKWGIDLADHDLGADTTRYEWSTGCTSRELSVDAASYELDAETAGCEFGTDAASY